MDSGGDAAESGGGSVDSGGASVPGRGSTEETPWPDVRYIKEDRANNLSMRPAQNLGGYEADIGWL